MKISAISDVHVKYPGDEAQKLLEKFLDHPQVKSSQHVLLLGDIFDLMCGPHEEYIKDFDPIFRKMTDLASSGVKVHFFEGNHDVHLQKLFQKIWPGHEIISCQSPEVQEWEGKKYYFSHGDEHEPHNESYQKYKALILSRPLRFVANHVMPYRVLKFAGERASAMSRKKGSKIFNEEQVRKTFRDGVTEVTGGKYDFVLGGHSHVQDMFQNGRTLYINNGYALRSKTFIHIDNHQAAFVPLA